MKRYTYKELMEIIPTHQYEPDGVKINAPNDRKGSLIFHRVDDIMKECRIRLDKDKIINYFNSLKRDNSENAIVDIGVIDYIHHYNLVVHELTKEEEVYYLGSSEYDKMSSFICRNKHYFTDRRMFLLKWSDGLYTPINVHEPSLPFYVDLREDP